MPLGHFARHHAGLTIVLCSLTVVGTLALGGLDSETLYLVFAALGVLFVGLAMADVRAEFRKRTS